MVRAQDAAGMTLTELQTEASALVDSKAFIEARPYLMELVTRFEAETGPLKDSLESVYFYLGVGYLIEYSEEGQTSYLNDAIKWMQRLNNEFPNGQFAVLSNLAMADAYRGLQKFNDAAKVYTKLLSPPLEFELKAPQRQEALRKITEAYYIARNWAVGTPWFLKYLDESTDPDDRANAAAALMEAYINQDRFDDTLKLLPFLVGESPARYKLQLNVALIEAGDKLSKAERYNEAMLMYRMVLTVEEIITWQEKHLTDLRGQLDLLRITTTESDRMVELETDIFNTEAQLKALRALTPYTPELKVRIARTFLLTGRDWESFYAYKQMIEEYPNHKNVEDFMYATFTAATTLGLTDEVITIGEDYIGNPGFKNYLNDIIVKLCQFYIEKERYEEFFGLAKKFIQQNPDDRYTSQIVYLMGSSYVKLERYEEMISLFRDYLKDYPNSPMREGCHYWVGLGDIFIGDYADAVTQFNAILKEYAGGPYAEDALYRRGICFFGVQQFDDAEKDFLAFVKKYPDSRLRGEAEFFLGDIYAAQAKVPQAIRHYTNVEKYTDSPTFIRNSYFQKGAVYEANSRYNEMASNFQTYMDKYRETGDLTGAIYQLGRARELQGRPQDMLQEYITGVKRFGNDPMSYGIDLILNVYGEKYDENRKKIDQTLAFLEKFKGDEAFREQIINDRQFLFQYLGDNPAIDQDIQEQFYGKTFREGLLEDMGPVDTWLASYRESDAAFPKELPAETFRKAYREAEQNGENTLAMRLAMAMSNLGTEVDEGKLYTEEDLMFASPDTLIWIGKRTEDFDDFLARKAYEMVIEQHPDSDLSRLAAMLALADLNQEAGQYDEALFHYRQAEEAFPASADTVRAVIGQADSLRFKGDMLGARDKYKQVVGRREWRGKPQAEALFKSGLTHFEKEEWELAQGYFERVYIGHAGFRDWASAAYYHSGQALERMGKLDDARRTYDEFLNNESFKDSEYYQKIKDARSALE